MSTILLDAAVAYVRAGFTKAQAADVRAYGGEFNAVEVSATSYNCPAILMTVLGWRPEPQPKTLVGRNVRLAKMAAFVAFKHANREERLRGAALLSEALCMKLKAWKPDHSNTQIDFAPLYREPMAENMYGRAIDAKGQALWLVTWEQEYRAIVPEGTLYDLIAIEIESLAVQGDPVDNSPAPAPAPTVTHELQFQDLPPAT